jgi:hypothetical protein
MTPLGDIIVGKLLESVTAGWSEIHARLKYTQGYASGIRPADENSTGRPSLPADRFLLSLPCYLPLILEES